MRKIFELDDRFPTGEPTIQLVMTADGRGGRFLEKRAFDSAAESPAYEFLKTVTPKAGHSIVLVNALGAYEAYDDNRNGDSFPDSPVNVGVPVRCGHPGCQGSAWIDKDETLKEHFRSFEKHGGIYLHHKNKNPKESLGSVLKAVWNAKMRRVELLLEIVNERDTALAKKIADGEYPAVSMGCMQSGTLVTLADGRRVPIEDIQLGDTVLTHLGNTGRVFQLHRRMYVGVRHTIKAEATPEIVCTHEHPFHVVKSSQVRRRNAKGAWEWNPNATIEGVWKLAEELNPDEHYLLQPIDRRVRAPKKLGYAFARLLGYYVAEGCILRDKNGIVCGAQFSCNHLDELPGEIAEICRELRLPAPYLYQPAYSEKALTVTLYHRATAERLALLGGTGAKTKALHPSVMLWPIKLQRALFGAYANGDGCGNANGSLQVSTASHALASQWLALLPRFNVLASHQVLQHKPSKLVTKATTEHVVFIGAQWAQALRDVCAKVQFHELRARKESRKIIGNYIVTPIRSIKREAGEMPVYNFEVGGDNSYCVEGIAVHNCHVRWDICSICGHRAPTRKDYCDHARNKMRQILSNGEKVCVHNPSPRFFDISFVFRPADPTGFMLKKVAEHGPAWIGFSAEAGERADALEQKIADVRKLSDIRKELLGRITASRYAAIARANAKARKPASDKELAKLSAYPLSVIVSTFAAKNAALSTSDVSRLFLKRAGMNTPDWLIDRLVAIQPTMTEAFAQAPNLLDKVASLIEVDARHVNPGLFPLVDEWIEKHAGMSDYMEYQAFGGGGLPVGPGAAYRMSDPPRTDILTLTDPNTGHVRQTTRGAAQQAHHADMKHKLFGTALLAAVYAGGLHAGGKALLKPKVPLWLTLPAAAYLGHKTYETGVNALSPLRNRTYLTDQGIEVPGNTEFVKTNAYRPTPGTEVAVSSPVLMDKLAFDVIERVGDRPDPVRALAAKIASHAPRAAISSFLLLDATDEEKSAALCAGVEVADGVDMLLLAERVGSLLLS